MSRISFLKTLSKLVFFLVLIVFLSGCIFAKTDRIYVSSDRGAGIEVALEAKEAKVRVMTIKELALAADLIAKVKTVKLKPVSFRTESGIYSQLANVKVIDILKGKAENKDITIYAKNRRIPYQYQASYEIYDELLVFLKKERGHYITLNNCYGQMPIYDKIVTKWHKKENGEFKLNLSLSYSEAKKRIRRILNDINQLEQKSKKNILKKLCSYLN